MEISAGRLSEPGLLPSRRELVSSESQSDWLPTTDALLLPRINVPPFHGQCGTVEVRLHIDIRYGLLKALTLS